MALLERIIKKILDQGVIVSKEKLNSNVYKIEIKSESIAHLDFIPGCFIRLAIGIGSNVNSKKDMVRSYSIWDINKTEHTISIAIATHSNGIGAQWVKKCNVGDTVYYKTKKGTFTVDTSADSYLMIGDLSAVSHMYMINQHLPKHKQVESLIYNTDITELYSDIDGKTPFNFHQIDENNSKGIIAKIDSIIPRMKGVKMVYIAGDSRVCITLNKYFRNELQWRTKQIKTKPFWNPDKKGLE